MGRVAYLYDPLFLDHDPGPGHPESPERLRAIQEHLTARGMFEKIDIRPPPPVGRDDLALIHSEQYIDHVLKHRGIGPAVLDGGDTIISKASVDAALVAAGAATESVHLVFEQDYDHVFAATRPPGHHARPQSAMGFCIFNNIALCAAYALQSQVLSRVLIVDWDVHHGNGTQEMFYASDQVYYLSMHQAPFYPLTGNEGEVGVGPGHGFTKNIPLPAGKTDDHYVSVLERALSDIEESFKPELVLISAGFDAHIADPIGGMQLTEDGFGKMTELVAGVARRHAEGRIISFLEGGYDQQALASCVERHLGVLLES